MQILLSEFCLRVVLDCMLLPLPSSLTFEAETESRHDEFEADLCMFGVGRLRHENAAAEIALLLLKLQRRSYDTK